MSIYDDIHFCGCDACASADAEYERRFNLAKQNVARSFAKDIAERSYETFWRQAFPDTDQFRIELEKTLVDMVNRVLTDSELIKLG